MIHVKHGNGRHRSATEAACAAFRASNRGRDAVVGSRKPDRLRQRVLFALAAACVASVLSPGRVHQPRRIHGRSTDRSCRPSAEHPDPVALVPGAGSNRLSL